MSLQGLTFVLTTTCSLPLAFSSLLSVGGLIADLWRTSRNAKAAGIPSGSGHEANAQTPGRAVRDTRLTNFVKLSNNKCGYAE